MDEIPEHVIEQCRKGSPAAFADIVRRYERPLFAYVYRLGCTPTSKDPEDVVQEIFVKAYQGIGRYKNRRGCFFSSWLFSIARNHCVSLMRRMKLEHRVFRPLDAAANATSGSESCPLEAISRKETAQQVAEATAKLPEAMRSAFLLRYYQDMSYEQIAQVLECSIGTVRSRLARARKAIQNHLQKSGSHTGGDTKHAAGIIHL
jgi:RNA polymerase sigma-70 factor (ECF subfamily)